MHKFSIERKGLHYSENRDTGTVIVWRPLKKRILNRDISVAIRPIDMGFV